MVMGLVSDYSEVKNWRMQREIQMTNGDSHKQNSASPHAEVVRLQALSKELKINNLVIFLGKRSQDSLPYYYSAAQVVVVPSLPLCRFDA